MLVRELGRLDKQFRITICGSYRRGLTEMDDIDIMLTHDKYVSQSFIDHNKESIDVSEYIIQNKASPKCLIDEVIHELTKIGFIYDTIALGETKYMVLL